MIISASRRTDIPAFYSEWLVNRLQAGYLYVRNPLNPMQISKIPLSSTVVDCIVFWTKNAAPMMDKLDKIAAMGYLYYFQWTLTPYGSDVERHVPDKAQVIDSFKALSNKIGSQRTIWRYDPVIVSRQFTVDDHVHTFAKLCRLLKGYTRKCVFSYVDLYAGKSKRMQGIVDSEVDTQTMLIFAERFSEIAKRNNIALETCAEQLDLSRFGIKHSSCINKQVIEAVTGCPIKAKKASGQRPFCECLESIDIGAYDCCSHGCVYCYATASEKAALKNMQRHDVHSPLLIGKPGDNDKITERAAKTLKNSQIGLF